MSFTATLKRELLLAFRRPAEVINPLFFFVMVVAMFPLGVSPKAELLSVIAPGVVWVAALLASILPLEKLVADDLDAGFFDQLHLRGIGEEWAMAVRLIAHWLAFAPKV